MCSGFCWVQRAASNFVLLSMLCTAKHRHFAEGPVTKTRAGSHEEKRTVNRSGSSRDGGWWGASCGGWTMAGQRKPN
ncbi:hypothetical protein F5144DRAFT_42315 [Chaetomium tenue]|uniref:Uncharacterized protein n=1 Tax=Chaetomium tenue TaxID=1854479 RepID=A0ACB7PMM3_9PEZI|nr:hypothetical protein F5144DRAFT_42315 [Chaetomium globosum]